jgi:hypothetical protein
MNEAEIAEWKRLAEIAMHALVSSGKACSEATAEEAFSMAELMLAEADRRLKRAQTTTRTTNSDPDQNFSSQQVIWPQELPLKRSL